MSEIVEEAQAVEEIVGQEALTVDEIIERMPEGWILVSKDHFEGIIDIKNQQRKRANDAEELLALRKAQTHVRLSEIARDLAEAGNYPHREKNEVILRAIASILKIDFWDDSLKENDDIPF